MPIVRIPKWDNRFLELAKFISQWSKDPSTKVGAVITDQRNRVVSLGFNGLPAGVNDGLPDRLNDRTKKLAMIVHGDENALLFAGRSVVGYTMYTYPFPPCSRCAGLIIQSGVSRVVAPSYPDSHPWAESVKLTEVMFVEARVQLDLFDFS